MIVKKSSFVKSCASRKDFVEGDISEVAFVGRSNVGKSTLINNLLNRKNLAKTSSTPGRTQLINYFLVNDDLHFVDLPGYGYHKAGKGLADKWNDMIGDYLLNSKNLKKVFVLVDIRHEPSALDKEMIKYLSHYALPLNVIATKPDKVKKSQLFKHRKMIASSLALGTENVLIANNEYKDIWAEIEKVK